MRVFLRKTQKVGDKTLEKNTEGWIWCCKLDTDSFLVDFKDIRIEVTRRDLDFMPVK